ncbi:MAG TPA: class IV adenylate cyclase [Candidatus Acidoferrum sp.]|nr:class IV adenylate cyclase [Candidatus Acidoferrum sp.]
MPRETEIKLRITDRNALLRALKRLHASSSGQHSSRVHESNVIFDTPLGDLAKAGQLLRIRVETPSSKNSMPASKSRAVVTFKRPTPGRTEASADAHRRFKVREELEFEAADPAALSKLFEGLGLRGWFRYEKYRTTYRLPSSVAWARGLLIELDETPIGTFVELEGPPPAIDRAARELGFSPSHYILKNYLSLHLEECRRQGREPGDMLFSRPKSVSPKKKN